MRLAVGIDVQDDFRHLTPVGIVGCRIEQPDISDQPLLIITGQDWGIWRDIGDIRVKQWPKHRKIPGHFQRRTTPSSFNSPRDAAFDENTPWLNTLQVAAVSSMEIREVFARNLRNSRQAAGLSQEELAHRAQIDRTYISALERSVYAASIDVVDRLADILGIEAADLLRRSAPPEKTDS